MARANKPAPATTTAPSEPTPRWRVNRVAGSINRNGIVYRDGDIIPLDDEEAAALAEWIEAAE